MVPLHSRPIREGLIASVQLTAFKRVIFPAWSGVRVAGLDPVLGIACPVSLVEALVTGHGVVLPCPSPLP